MTDVFVSYARADRARVEPIARGLEALGFDVWWDPNLLPGEQYASAIGEILQSAKAILVVWSANAVERDWVLDEAAVGRDRRALVSTRIDASAPPLGFRQVPAIDLSTWSGAPGDANFQTLVQALSALRGAAPMPIAIATAMSPPPPTKAGGLGRWLLAAGAVALVAGGIYAASQFLPIGPAAPDPDQVETTDAPGAADSYGLSEEERLGFGPQDLIRIALATTDFEAIEQGAGAGDGFGQALSCLAYGFGEGVPQDLGLARAQCDAAAAQGEGLAIFMLSRWARAGEAGYSANATVADALLMQAADARDPRALTELARQDLEAGNAQEAAVSAEAAALLGHHPAQILMGWMSENGQGLPQNDQEAFRWYDAAAEKAFPAGLTATGRLLEEGRGVTQDYARARARYEEAAGQGDGEAANRLARLLEAGLGGAADPARAQELRQTAIDAGVIDQPPVSPTP
jgi:TPR repeat protein